MLQFEYPKFFWIFLVFIPLIMLVLTNLYWKKNVKKSMGNNAFVNKLISNYSAKKYTFKITLVLVATALAIIASTNLRKPIAEKGSTTNGIDVMIALDVSKSMLSQDEKPSRLEKSKQFIYQLAQNLQNNNIGLVVFAGEAFLQMPLTSDMAAASVFISNANTDLVSLQGTVVSDALALCDASLNTKQRKSKAVVLITDGDDHDDKALEIAKKLNEHGTAIYTIGVGSVTGAPIIEAGSNDYKRDKDGQTVITKLNETLLKDLANNTAGEYFLLNNTATVAANLANQLNKLEKKQITNAGGNINYQSYYMYFVALAIVLLLIEFFISERKNKLAI